MEEVRRKTKRVEAFDYVEGAPADLGTETRQDLGCKAVCASCPRRFEGWYPVGEFIVGSGEKADKGSKDPGPNALDEVVVCFHPDRVAPLYGHPPVVEPDPIKVVDAVMEANLPAQMRRLGIDQA